MKRVSLRVVTGLVLTAILLTALAAYFAWAATPSTDFWISPGVYPGAPSYTIWRDGSNYFAKDQNGYQAYSGTTFATVFQSCISDHHEIFLCAGTYLTTATLIVNKHITIRGEGNGTIILLQGNINVFNVTSDDVRFYNFALRGQDYDGTAIYLNNVVNCRIQNLDIRNFGVDGLYINGTGGNHWVGFNKIVNCGDHAIYIGNGSADNYIIGNDLGAATTNTLSLSGTGHDVITGNRIYMGGWNGTAYTGAYNGIDLYGCNFENVVGNQISHNGGSGIRIYNTNSSVITGNYIANNDYYNAGRAGIIIENLSKNNLISSNVAINDAPPTTQDYGIYETDNANFNNILGIQAFNNTVAGIITVGANTTVTASYNGTTWID